MMKLFVPVLLLLPSSLVSALHTNRLATQEQDPPARQLGSLCTQCETVQIAFHILGNSAGNNKAATYWNDNRINWEVDFLNERWASTPFKFVLRKLLVKPTMIGRQAVSIILSLSMMWLVHLELEVELLSMSLSMTAMCVVSVGMLKEICHCNSFPSMSFL